MNKLIITLLFITLHFFGFGQRLSKSDIDSISIIMDKMLIDDQQYRWEIMLGELDSTKFDSLKKLPLGLKNERIVKVMNNEVGFGQTVKDSLWVLQHKLDSLNSIKFIQIIKTYGYPSYKRTKSDNADVFLTHMTGEKKLLTFKKLFYQELKEGNLPASEYASWYDRCQLSMKRNQLYGEYDKIYPCVNDLKLSNIERKKIGLKKLKENNCR